MCFYHDDYDWRASVVEHAKGNMEGFEACMECGQPLYDGDWRHRVFQQEHEECQICEELDVDEDGQPIAEHECDYGESYEYVRCHACEKLLDAIRAVEVREGCPPAAQQPCYEGLGEEMWEHQSAYEYADEAITLFPELWDHPFITRLLERSGC